MEIFWGFLSIIFDEADLKNRTNQLVNNTRNLNKKHIIQCYNGTQFNIPEEPHYRSCMTPTGFINGQDESICYVNSSFQVFFLNI